MVIPLSLAAHCVEVRLTTLRSFGYAPSRHGAQERQAQDIAVTCSNYTFAAVLAQTQPAPHPSPRPEPVDKRRAGL